MSKESKIKIIVAFFIVLMVILIFVKFERENNHEVTLANKMSYIFQDIDPTTYAEIDKYIVYGTHLNLEGNLKIPKISEISIYSTNIIIRNVDGSDERKCTADYTYKDNVLSFSTIDKINTGISLESIENNQNYLFLKVVFSNNEIKYYSLLNNTEYDNVSYYALTKKNKLDIKFDKFQKIPYMMIHSSSIKKLPDDVYDIVIDPAHGGLSTGARYKNYTEADLVLKCAKSLKSKLEEKGYKVFLTRDGTEPKDSNMETNMYDENGRVNTSQSSKSKLLISLNINDTYSRTGGLEVYAPCNCNLDFAKLLAKNIVNKTKTSYSSAKLYKQSDGVYVHNFNNLEILGQKNAAILRKYEPYPITTSTPFLYMIREVGGIATNAYVDGRNTNYGKNKYFNSNVGIESYSIELGYMRISKDLDNIVNNTDLYAEAICNSIVEFYMK